MFLSFNMFSSYSVLLLIRILKKVITLNIAVLIERKNLFYMNYEFQQHNHWKKMFLFFSTQYLLPRPDRWHLFTNLNAGSSLF